MPRVAEHFQQTLQEPHGTEMVQLAPDPGAALGRRRDVRLAAQPRGQGVRHRSVPGHHGRTIRAQSLREGGGPDGDSREPLFQEPFHGGVHRLVPAPGQAGIGGGYVGLQREQPGIQHRAERARREGGRAEGLADPPVDGLQLVQRSLGLGDLHLGGGEPSAQGPFGQVTGEEGLAGAILATDGLERGRRPRPRRSGRRPGPE